MSAGAKIADLLVRYQTNLIMLHFMGGSDTDAIIEQARRAAVPVAVQNHFSNDRFLHLSIRKHVTLAHGVAGVTAIGVPEYLRHRFKNLADGIDTDFLKRENVKSPKDVSDRPIILLPARVVRSKGHMDLIKAGLLLRKRGLDFQILFAGRNDSDEFEQELRTAIVLGKLADRVHFLGPLSQEELRDCYASSTVVGFPTYHHEGLPRVILEAQAMQVPPVAYATGGLPDGLVPDRTGFLVQTGDIRNFADKLEQILQDNEIREQMGKEGRHLIEERFSLAALAQRHEEFYQSVISS